MQQDVNYIEHLKNINIKFYDDKLITSSHVAVYNSLFQFWNKSFFDTDLSINRGSVMKQAKIGSVNTYLKCLKELEMQGYLKYNTSHNPLIGSIVNLFRFDTTPDIVVIKSDTSSDTTPDIVVIPYINIETIKPETLKLLNENASLVDDCLKDWIREQKLKPKVEIDFDNLKTYWNIAFMGSKIKPINEVTIKRKKAIIAVLKHYSKDQIKTVIDNAKNSNFLCGINDRNWIVDFNWVFIVDNFTKILEGKYENKADTSKRIFG